MRTHVWLKHCRAKHGQWDSLSLFLYCLPLVFWGICFKKTWSHHKFHLILQTVQRFLLILHKLHHSQECTSAETSSHIVIKSNFIVTLKRWTTSTVTFPDRSAARVPQGRQVSGPCKISKWPLVKPPKLSRSLTLIIPYHVSMSLLKEIGTFLFVLSVLIPKGFYSTSLHGLTPLTELSP